MKKQIYIITLFLFFVLPYSVFSQNFQTSTEPSAERMALLEKASQAVINNEYQSDNDYVIPLTIHILHETDGSGGTSLDEVLETFCDVVTHYAEYGITLYIDTIRHTNNSNFYNNSNLNTMAFLLNDENTVNIYMLNDDSSPALCFHSPNQDVIVFAGDGCLGGVEAVRMLGFYFGLAATFNGFQGLGDNCGVQMTSGEKVDGSNCDTAGDRICDTPPDYNASYLWQCDANGEGCIQIDPDGVEFRPDGTNFMSVSNCRSRFSPMQEQAMKYNIDESLQNLSVLPVPSNLSEITATSTLLSPANEADDVFHQAVHFNWESVENASHYLIEINRVTNFSPTFEVASTIVATNEYTNNDLLPDITYYWRIKPYNAGYLCAPFSDINSFTTTLETNIESIDGLESFEIYPNPTIAGEAISIELQSDKHLEGTLSLHNVHGQTVYSNAITMNGTNRFEIKTEDLPVILNLIQNDG